MMHVFLKLRVYFILARKIAGQRRYREEINQRFKVFRRDQARVDARMIGLVAREYRANLIEMRRLNDDCKVNLEVLRDSISDCPTEELQEVFRVLTGQDWRFKSGWQNSRDGTNSEVSP